MEAELLLRAVARPCWGSCNLCVQFMSSIWVLIWQMDKIVKFFNAGRRGNIPLWLLPSAYTILYFLTQGCTPWVSPTHPPHPSQVKVELRPEPMWPTTPLFLGSGGSNMLKFFDFEKKFQIFACRDLRKKIWAVGGGNDKFFLEKSHMFLGKRPP